ncbi:MAG: hypothetical protein KME04_16625 [Pleurocapsa minor GSE-CHR-MK-17-07R]|jgi:hypothetical protein|nr:hypothetical protein [Pleurocapsa minor GSE-CHR-MK 17-07R]
MAAKLNPAAVEFARSLIDEGKYRINTQWKIAAPSQAQAEGLLASQGWDEFSRWFLVVDETSGDAASASLPIGDLKSVHRSGLLAAQTVARGAGQTDVVDAAQDLIDWIDRFNAC